MAIRSHLGFGIDGARRRRDAFTESKRLQLLCGYDFFRDGYGEGANLDLASAEADWQDHGPELLREFLAEQSQQLRGVMRQEAARAFQPEMYFRGMIRRPWAWWQFERHEDPLHIDQADYLEQRNLLTPLEREYLDWVDSFEGQTVGKAVFRYGRILD